MRMLRMVPTERSWKRSVMRPADSSLRNTWQRKNRKLESAGRDVAVEIHACGVLEPGAAVEIAVHGEAGAAERGFQRGEARIGRIEPGETNRLDAVGGYFARDLVKRLR